MSSRLRRFQLALKKFGGNAPLFYGRGYAFFPFARPIATVVGAPLRVERYDNPTPEQVDTLHAAYCEALEALFESHKSTYGVPPDTHLEFAAGD